MSWWVCLKDTTAEPTCDYGTPLDQWQPRYSYETEPCPEPCYPSVIVDRHAEGGIYVMGGTSEGEINVTYNYGGHFRDALHDPNPGESDVLARLLNNRRAGDVVTALEQAVARLGTARSADYWEATPGNAGYALSILLSWARQHPDAVFKVS